MNIRVVNKSELIEWIRNLDPSPAIALLFVGDRLTCCDEAVGVEIEGKIAAIATIAPEGEFGVGGRPTIVALYTLSEFRQMGYGRSAFEAVLKRCRERGFSKVHIDVMSSYVMRIIEALSEEDRAYLDVYDHGPVMDIFS